VEFINRGIYLIGISFSLILCICG